MDGVRSDERNQRTLVRHGIILQARGVHCHARSTAHLNSLPTPLNSLLTPLNSTPTDTPLKNTRCLIK
jgi:hypothetical protein